MLLERFFPEPKADFFLIPNRDMDLITFKETVKINWEVDTRDVSVVISMVLLNKVLGPDRLSNKLLKACNEEERLSEVLLPII